MEAMDLVGMVVYISVSGAGDLRGGAVGGVITEVKVVGDPCQKITLLLLKSKSVRVIVPESFFLKENTYL